MIHSNPGRVQMKIHSTLIVGILLVVITAGAAHAFDDERSGFMMALGLGFGMGEASWDEAGGTGEDSGSGAATELRLGHCWRDNLWIYAVNRALFFEGDTPDNLVQGLAGVGAAWFFEPRDRVVYLTGELGVGVRRNEEIFHSDDGFGFALGAGWEFREHWIVETNYMKATVEDDGWPQQDLTNISISIGWIGY
jgi:Outer membrane protein beta-barrel domain